MDTIGTTGRHLWLCLVFAAVTSGCVVNHAAIQDKRLLVPPGGETGYVVGSIGIVRNGTNKSGAAQHELRVRNLENGAHFRLAFSGSMMKSPADFEDGEVRIAVFRLPLPPGEYEIYKAHFLVSSPYVTLTYENESNFSLPIQILPDRDLYIGEYLASRIPVRGFLGLTEARGYRFDIADRHERDFELLMKKYPEFADTNTIVSIPGRAIIIDPPNVEVVTSDAGPAEAVVRPTL